MDAGPYDRLIERLATIVANDDRILAVLVYGSRASGEADEHSDLDIGIVAADAPFDDVVASAPALIRALGEPVFLEHFGNPARLHAILAGGAAVEVMIQREDELTLELPHRVVVDRAGVVERALARPARAAEPTLNADEVRRRITWFWHDVDHLVTALARGDTWWAWGQIDELRRVCINLARLDAGEAAEDEAYWKLDRALAPSRLAALLPTVAPPERAPMVEAGLAAVALFRDVAVPLAARHGVTYPTELDRLVSDRLEVLGGTHRPAP